MDFNTAVKTRHSSLSEKEKQITNYILENIDSLKTATILEIAEVTNSSTSSLSRLVRKLGYANFHSMKMSFVNSGPYKSPSYSDLPAQVGPDNSPLEIGTVLFQNGVASLLSTQEILDNDVLNKATDILGKSDHCVFFGLGGSSVVTLNAYHRFIKSSLQCTHCSDYHMQLLEASRLTSEDSAIVVSHSGRNKDMLRIMDILVSKGVRTVCITSDLTSPLAKRADCNLLSVAEETNYQPEGMSSMVSQILLVDLLYLSYSVRYNKNRKYFANARQVISDTRL